MVKINPIKVKKPEVKKEEKILVPKKAVPTSEMIKARERAKELGLPVDGDMPERIQKIAETFPCVSSVQYRKPKKNGDDSSLRITL